MAEMPLEEKMRYYNELALQLKSKGFEIPGLSPLNELLVNWNGRRLCVITQMIEGVVAEEKPQDGDERK